MDWFKYCVTEVDTRHSFGVAIFWFLDLYNVVMLEAIRDIIIYSTLLIEMILIRGLVELVPTYLARFDKGNMCREVAYKSGCVRNVHNYVSGYRYCWRKQTCKRTATGYKRNQYGSYLLKYFAWLGSLNWCCTVITARRDNDYNRLTITIREQQFMLDRAASGHTCVHARWVRLLLVVVSLRWWLSSSFCDAVGRALDNKHCCSGYSCCSWALSETCRLPHRTMTMSVTAWLQWILDHQLVASRSLIDPLSLKCHDSAVQCHNNRWRLLSVCRHMTSTAPD